MILTKAVLLKGLESLRLEALKVPGVTKAELDMSCDAGVFRVLLHVWLGDLHLCDGGDFTVDVPMVDVARWTLLRLTPFFFAASDCVGGFGSGISSPSENASVDALLVFPDGLPLGSVPISAAAMARLNGVSGSRTRWALMGWTKHEEENRRRHPDRRPGHETGPPPLARKRTR